MATTGDRNILGDEDITTTWRRGAASGSAAHTDPDTTDADGDDTDTTDSGDSDSDSTDS